MLLVDLVVPRSTLAEYYSIRTDPIQIDRSKHTQQLPIKVPTSQQQTTIPSKMSSPPPTSLTTDNLISSLESALSTSPYGIEGVDSEDDPIGTIATLNNDFMSSRSDWYSAALDYWDEAEPTHDGMLGGFANLSPSDLEASTKFLQHLQQEVRPQLNLDVSCECGAGIGRVTKGLFLPLNFKRCDLVEVSSALLSSAPEYINDSKSSRCKFYCTGLQDFEPKPETYDVIWVQWCVGYLTDLDCAKFLERMGNSLRDGGVVVIKDNTCTGNAFVLDRDDSSVTRSLDYLLALAELAGLRVVYQRMQGEDSDANEFPDDIFPVPMIALERVHEDKKDSANADTGTQHVAGGEYGKEEAVGYRDAKQVPFRERIELFTTLQLVGDASGKRVIDVACGTGWLTRELKYQAKAAYVMGTDLSIEMIDLAKKEDPTIDYKVEDVMQAMPGDYDIVTSNWLLVNARTRSELRSMCNGLALKAKSGGKLVTIITNPDLFGYGDTSFMKKYGFEFVFPKVVAEGEAILIKCYTPTGEFAVEVENYYFSKDTYIEELRAAGFRDVAIHDPKLAPLPSVEDDSEYWSSLFSCPLFLAITATKE